MTGLTVMELEVLAGAAQDESAQGTADRLDRSVYTVKQHRKAVLHKLSCRSMTGAVGVAYRRGILGVQANPDRLPITDGQRRAFNKKASDIDAMRNLDPRTTKKLVIGQASLEFSRPIESVNDLDRREASLVLDLLERILDGAASYPGRGEQHLILNSEPDSVLELFDRSASAL